jgi:hypothetical protein
MLSLSIYTTLNTSFPGWRICTFKADYYVGCYELFNVYSMVYSMSRHRTLHYLYYRACKKIYQTTTEFREKYVMKSSNLSHIVPQSIENHARSLFENIYFTEREESTASDQESHLLKLLYTFLQIGEYK